MKIFLFICLIMGFLFLPTAILAEETSEPTLNQNQMRFPSVESEKTVTTKSELIQNQMRFPSIESEKTVTAETPLSITPTLSVITDRIRYIPEQNVIIMGMVYDQNGNTVRSKVNLSVTYIPDNEKGETQVYKQSTLSQGELGYSDSGINLEGYGLYKVTATTTINGQQEISHTQFKVVNYAETPAAWFMILGIAALSSLMIIIGRKMTYHITIREVLRFVCISLIAFSPVAIFILTDVEIGQNSPMGLVVVPKFPEDANMEDVIAGNVNPIGKEWMINLGGNWHTYYTSGIQIPVFVFIFGIAGGYIRYLYKTWQTFDKPEKLSTVLQNMINESKDPEKEKQEIKNNMLLYTQIPHNTDKIILPEVSNEEKIHALRDLKHMIKMAVLHNSMMDLSLLFLSPLLAIASYFILLQSGVTENDFPTIAAVSFGVGLGTDAIVKRLKSLVDDNIDKATSKKDKNE